MTIIVSSGIPKECFTVLERKDRVIRLSTTGITYDAIAGHPDVFMAPVRNTLVVAPNLPDQIKKQIAGHAMKDGSHPVGLHYPGSARYNAAISDKLLVHNLKYTDRTLLTLCAGMKTIHVEQGYTRCNLILFRRNRYITSDPGIHKTLVQQGMKGIYVFPEGILLPGYNHGFVGGTCGLSGDEIFFIGSLEQFREGERIRDFLQSNNYRITELYEGPLFDGGSILFQE